MANHRHDIKPTSRLNNTFIAHFIGRRYRSADANAVLSKKVCQNVSNSKIKYPLLNVKFD